MSYDPGNEYDRPESKFKLASEGDQVVQITKCNLAESKKGNAMWVMEFTCLLGSTRDAVVKRWQTIREEDHYDMTEICRAANAKLREKGSGFEPTSQGSLNEFLLGSVLALSVYHEKRIWDGKEFIDARVGRNSIRMLTKAEKAEVKAEYGLASGPEIDAPFSDDAVPF